MVQDDLYQQAIEYYSNKAIVSPRDCVLDLYKNGYTWKGRLVLVPLNIWGGLVMVRGKSKGNHDVKAKATWNTTFVDIPLAGYTPDQIFAQWGVPDEVVDLASGLLESGYRIGFSFNPQNEAFICSVTCKAEESVNVNCTFTAFAGSWFEALQVALFKHFVIAQEQWRSAGGNSDRPIIG